MISPCCDRSIGVGRLKHSYMQLMLPQSAEDYVISLGILLFAWLGIEYLRRQFIKCEFSGFDMTVEES